MRVPAPALLGAFLVATSALLPFHRAEAQQPLGPDSPLPLDPQVRMGTLDNGLRYYVRANERPEGRAELRLVINAGSILEDNDQRGLAHFLEHMAFNGTRNFERTELVRYLESIGMRFGPDLNAYTSFDETVYMLTIPTDAPDVVETAFLILEDWASGLLLEPDDIEGERGVVIEEWRARLGAQARLTDAQIPVLLEGSRYPERLPIGLRETLETFPHEALVRFYERWYRPDLMAVIAVGDFDAAGIEALIEERFGALDRPAEPAERPAHPVPSRAETAFLITRDAELTNTRVEVLRRLPPGAASTLADFRRSLVEEIYNGMLSARLSEIAQKPDAPFLGAYSSRGGFVRAADLYGLGAVVPEGGVARGLEALLLEAERVARHGFTATELDRARLNLLRSYERAYAERERTNSGVYADEYIRHFLEGSPIAGIEFEYQLAQLVVPGVALEEVNELANSWLAEDNRVVLVSAPEGSGSVPNEAGLRALLEAAAGAVVEPYVDLVVEAPLVEQPPVRVSIVREVRHDVVDVLEWQLANGVRVFLKATDFRDDEIVFNAFAPGGLSLAPDEEYTAASFGPDVARASGLGAFSLPELQRALAGKAASVTPYLSEFEQGLSGSASPADLEVLFQLIHLHFTAPRDDPDARTAFMDRLRSALANRGADPNAAFSDTLQLTLSQHHPRYPAPTPALIERVDLSRAHSFLAERFADAGGFSFVFVGNLDLGALRPLVESYLGSLPGTGSAEGWRDPGVRPPSGVVEKVVRHGLDPRALTQLVFSGEVSYSRENRYALRALADVLQLRLTEVLREDLGGTYGVQVAANPVSRPEPRYTFNIGFGASPEQLDALVGALFQEIERIKTEGPAELDIVRAREIQRRERETSLRQNGYWMGQLAGYVREGLDFADILRYEELIQALDADLVRDAARAFLRTDNYVRVSLLPAGG